jgi:hypothetical protein
MTLEEIKHRFRQVELLENNLKEQLKFAWISGECAYKLEKLSKKAIHHADWWYEKLEDAMAEEGEPEPMPIDPFDHHYDLQKEQGWEGI